MGDLVDLAHVREAATLPILRKDFLTDPYQVVETRAWGADSLLLIAALLDGPQLATLIRTAREWGMEPLVEAHSRLELEKALDSGARIVGINNRDLRTFSVNLETSLNLASLVPPDRIVVAESGIHSADDVRRLAAAGIKAALIGEALVKAPDATAKIGELTHGF
jgi:indole-3-glycerol phosphate synthase